MVFDKKEGFRGFFKKYAKSQFLDIEAISGGLWLKWGFGAFYWHRFWRSRSAILFDIVVTFKIKISYCLRSRSSFYQDHDYFLIFSSSFILRRELIFLLITIRPTFWPFRSDTFNKIKLTITSHFLSKVNLKLKKKDQYPSNTTNSNSKTL